MEIRIVKNVSKSVYKVINNELLLQIVEDNQVVLDYVCHKYYIFNPYTNEHKEIMPGIPKIDICPIYHSHSQRDYVFFASAKSVNKTSVELMFYCYRIPQEKGFLVHSITVDRASLMSMDIRVFVFNKDLSIFQLHKDEWYHLTLKNITDNKSMELVDTRLNTQGIRSIYPFKGNISCIEIGDSLIGVVNSNQFVSDLMLGLPIDFWDIIEDVTDNSQITLKCLYMLEDFLVYTKTDSQAPLYEIIMYDYVNGIKRVRQNDNLEIYDYKNICMINNTPYVFMNKDNRTFFYNLNSKREEFIVPDNLFVEAIVKDCVIVSRPSGFKLFGRTVGSSRLSHIEAYKIDDYKSKLFRRKGVYEGCLMHGDKLLLFIQ